MVTLYLLLECIVAGLGWSSGGQAVAASIWQARQFPTAAPVARAARAEGIRALIKPNVSLQAPFPWYGGKRLVAPQVWPRFGNPRNYVEPFAGSLACLLLRPWPHEGIETVNDINCWASNFYRAVTADPAAVARHADGPSSEADLLARNRWLQEAVDLQERLKREPEHFDAKVAGWWCNSVGGWLGQGFTTSDARAKLPKIGGTGVHRRYPPFGTIQGWITALHMRLRRVTVACGDWSRVTTPAVTYQNGVTAVFLDPPYVDDCSQDVYGRHPFDLAALRAWAIEAGKRPDMRIALCNYVGGLEMPADWSTLRWKAQGGYAKADGRGARNRERECVWFSPACLRPEDGRA